MATNISMAPNTSTVNGHVYTPPPQGVIAPPNTSNPISSSTITNGGTLSLPKGTIPSTTHSGIVAASQAATITTKSLSDLQKQGLDAASARVSSGTANQTDKNNIAYAQKNYGYSYAKPEQKGSSTPALDGVTDSNLPGMNGNKPAQENQPTTTSPGDYSQDTGFQKAQTGLNTAESNLLTGE